MKKKLFLLIPLVLCIVILASFFVYRNKIDKAILQYSQSIYHNSDQEIVYLEDLPDYVKSSVLISEDPDFYKYSKPSYASLLRGLVSYYLHPNATDRGLGHSISVRLVKNSNLAGTASNKFGIVKEAFVVTELDRLLSRDEILELYINTVSFGEGTIGIESASQHYFGKHAKELDLNEATFLSSLLYCPECLNNKSDILKQRQRLILEQM